MSEVVRQRLELLLAEVRPRHLIEDAPESAASPPLAVRPPGHVQADEGATPWIEFHRTESDEASQDDVGQGQAGHAIPRARAGPAVRAARLGVQVREFTRDHLTAVILVLVVGCSWTVYTLLQARSTPVAVAAAVPSVVASPTSTPTAPAGVLVHVLGAVHRPGLVELVAGSRVADAIAAAGGLLRTADPAELNLAAVVADGSQVVVGTTRKPRGEVRSADGSGVATASGTQASATGAVSLNTATLAQLDSLPGVGPVTAQKILDWREKHGRFSSVSELQEVDGIGPKTYADLAPHVRV